MNVKFMQTLDRDVYIELRAFAKERGVTIQEFLRAVVVSDWLLSSRGRRNR